jgi:hypothetical protein
MSASRPLQYGVWNTCSCVGVTNYAPTFDFTYLYLTMGGTGEKPIYVSLAGAATTSDFYVSTGPVTHALSLPSQGGLFSFTCTASGAEFSLMLLR